MPERTVERGRLVRALRLEVEELGHGRYSVRGGAEPHVVEIREDGRWLCECADSALRPSFRCKHILIVYLTRRLSPAVLKELREVVLASVTNLARRPGRARA